jgi:hypothetical protein
MWSNFFAYGGVAFWLLMLSAFCVIWAAMRRDDGMMATIDLCVLSFVLWLFGNINVFAWLYHHSHLVLIGIVIYLVGGIIYLWPKWAIFCSRLKERLRDIQSEWLTRKCYSASSLSKLEYEEWLSTFERKDFAREVSGDPQDVRPDPSQYKSEIITWMMYWPFIVTLFDDVVKRFWHWVFYALQGRLKAIASRMFKNADLSVKV